MVRRYRNKTAQLPPDRRLRIRDARRSQADAQKIAEVLIRVALREADDRDVGAYLREHLAEQS